MEEFVGHELQLESQTLGLEDVVIYIHESPVTSDPKDSLVINVDKLHSLIH